MLVNSKELLKVAKKERFAIPATNFIDLDSARVYVRLAEERNLPLILAFAQSHQDLISLEEAASIGRLLAENSSAPVVLHLHHGEDYMYVENAINLGFTSVMIDASQLPFNKNIESSKKVVEYAHQFNITVEAELGYVGANIENFEGHEEMKSVHTNANEVVEFIQKTGVDSLAVSIGTAHGEYKGRPDINFERLEEIDKATETPLVLHGGSSSGDDNLSRCAVSGISKINIFTDFINGAYKKIQMDDPNNYLGLKESANQGMKKVLDHYFDVFHTKPVNL